MAAGILNRILPLSKRHVGWRLHNAGTKMLCALEVRVDVIDCHVDVCVGLAPARRAIRATFAAEYDGAFLNRELRMANRAVVFSPETFRETERPAEPLDCLIDILVNQDGDNGGCWG